MTGVHITYHAVVRFLERHDGFDLTAIREVLGAHPDLDTEILRILSETKGLNVAAVRKRMITPALHTAVACGASGLRMGRVRFVIQDGIVVTVRSLYRDTRLARRPHDFARSQFVPLAHMEA